MIPTFLAKPFGKASPFLGCLLCVLLCSSPGLAAEGGYTNYLPGTYGDFGVAITPEPGFYFQNYLYYYSADANKEVRQGQVQFDVDLEIAMEFPLLFYVTDLKVFGGRFALGGGIPLVYADVSATIGVGQLEDSITEDHLGFGDAYLSGIPPPSANRPPKTLRSVT